MKINYTARNANLTPQIKKLCEKRTKSIEKLLAPPMETDVVLSTEKYRHIAEVNVRAKGINLNAEAETQDIYISLGLAFDNIERQAKKEKDKIQRKRRKNKSLNSYPPLPEEEEEAPRPRVIPSRNFSLKPLSIEEALMMFESMRDDAYGFRVFGSEKWAVLFRRKDGNIGLMELQ
ncbi:MAG: ribosome-associated translation inhibitor RaiA [Candidatus Aminicenantes bacterium]